MAEGRASKKMALVTQNAWIDSASNPGVAFRVRSRAGWVAAAFSCRLVTTR